MDETVQDTRQVRGAMTSVHIVGRYSPWYQKCLMHFTSYIHHKVLCPGITVQDILEARHRDCNPPWETRKSSETADCFPSSAVGGVQTLSLLAFSSSYKDYDSCLQTDPRG